MLGLRSLANSLKATRLPQRVNVVRAVPRPCVLFSQTRGIAFRASPFSRNQYTLPDGTVVPAYVKPPRSPYTLAGLVGFVVGAGLVLLFRTEDEKEDNQLAEEYVSILRKFNRDESLTPEDVKIVQSIQILHNDVPSVKTLILAAKVLIEAEERGFDVRITKRIADNLLNWTGKDEEEEIALRLLRLAYGRRCYSRAELVNDIEYLVGKIDSLDPKDLTVVGFAMLALGKNKQAHDVLSKAAHPVAKFVSKDDSFENLPSITFTEAPFPVALERSFNFATLTLPGKLYKGVAARDWAVLYNAGDHSLLRIKAAEFNSNEWVGAVSDKDGNTIPVRLGGAVSQG